ncbi:3-oxoacyl-ACP synthase [Streptomyces sp. PRh5]|uniref:3-oxoacyl-ACP synthase III family protein n=1 Tax=Streptomyces sp. PRh5 TaxID=1158056 RepID=UPI000445F662|nr:3-oxoacyl-[acyl-carrier-protein] synthase III C-terminal domain-containing protein [Streptomyces sp. PRh5]EXU63685.1 3-oxoacyl-ACP synthase [Streptomyces sp. PRh5]
MAAILDFEVIYPSGRITVSKMAEESGLTENDIRALTVCEGFPVLADGEHEWELALRAAQVVLERAAVPLSAIRTVIYAGTGEWDIPFWSPAAKVAHELGIEGAYCFEIVNYCNAVTAAIQYGTDQVDARPDGYVLVLGGDRVSTMLDYSDPGAKELFNQGDAASAVLISASGQGIAEMLGAKMRTDPSWCDYYTGVREGEQLIIRRHGLRDGLGEAYLENFTGLIRELLSSLGKNPTDISYLLVTHGDRRVHQRLLSAMELPTTKSVFNYEHLGHMGGADTLIAMNDLISDGRLRCGDLVLHATSALGFSWGVMAMEYVGR